MRRLIYTVPDRAMSTPSTDATLRRTALYNSHLASGAKMVLFAGWEMPVQYSGIRDEVRAVRETCGIFDVSHMGQLDVSGEGATEKLNRAISNDWSTLPVGRVAYALLLNEEGGVLDDVMGYRLGEDEWLVIVNASRAENDEAVLRSRLPNVALENRYGRQAMVAIQGPHAEEILASLRVSPAPASLSHRDCVPAEIEGAQGLLARGGYTGSDGFEFMLDAADAPRVWSTLLGAGAAPCGLGARDVLRLEAGLPLYGHELREVWTPFQSASGFAVKMEKEYFVGRDALRGKENPARRIKALRMSGNAIPREGYEVAQSGQGIGEVTSGTLSPTLGYGIALAMLPSSLQVGDAVEVLIRGKAHAAEVVKKPFVPFGKKS
jgi:aminomethyltransferase